tara:strand:+ start:324 stop:515 length:192 start_codon:yes stop_codon:yes gene_type:complete
MENKKNLLKHHNNDNNEIREIKQFISFINNEIYICKKNNPNMKFNKVLIKVSKKWKFKKDNNC